MENQIEITEKELIGLESITNSDYYESGRESVVWDFSVYEDCPLKGKTRSGVFSSLVKKGLVDVVEKEKTYIIDENGNKKKNPHYFRGEPNHGTLHITGLGYEQLDLLGLISEDGEFIQK